MSIKKQQHLQEQENQAGLRRREVRKEEGRVVKIINGKRMIIEDPPAAGPIELSFTGMTTEEIREAKVDAWISQLEDTATYSADGISVEVASWSKVSHTPGNFCLVLNSNVSIDGVSKRIGGDNKLILINPRIKQGIGTFHMEPDPTEEDPDNEIAVENQQENMPLVVKCMLIDEWVKRVSAQF